mgnify:CR=1 FL=1
MAITKLKHINDARHGKPSAHLKNAIYYVLQLQKNQNGLWMGGNAGITPEEIYDTMQETKKQWNNQGGRQGYHFFISFPPGTIDLPSAYSVIREFCQTYLMDSYDYVFSIHNDRPHCHGHIVFNSVSRENGKKYRYKKGDWANIIQPLVDDICEKYGLERLKPGENIGLSYGEWLQEKGKNINFRELLRRDIEVLLPKVETIEELFLHLKKKGYEIRWGNSRTYGTYAALRPKDGRRSLRTYTLGKGYSVEELKQRISMPVELKQANLCPIPQPPRIQRTTCVWIRKRTWYIGGLARSFLKQYFRKGVLYSYQLSERNYQDIKQIQQMRDNCVYPISHGIHTKGELNIREESLDRLMAALVKERKFLYRHLRLTGEEADAVKQYYAIVRQLEKEEKDSQEALGLAKERVRIEGNYSLEELSVIEAHRKEKLHDISKQMATIRQEKRCLEKIKNESKFPIKYRDRDSQRRT